jgi:hypothetical protein
VSVIIPPGFGELAFVLTGSAGTQPFIVTLGVDLTGVTTSFVDAANKAFGAYQHSFLVNTTHILSLDKVVLSIGQDDGTAPTVESNVPAVDGGIDSGLFAPLNIAAIMRKDTATLGRRGRGRMFIPGYLRAADVDSSGTVSDDARTSLNNDGISFGTQLFDDTPPPSLAPVLCHSSAPTVPTAIIGLTCAPLIGTLRKRIR